MNPLPIVLGVSALALGFAFAKKAKAKDKAGAGTGTAPTVTAFPSAAGGLTEPIGEPPPPLQGPTQEELDAAANHADLTLLAAVAQCPGKRPELEAAHADFAIHVVEDANEALATFLETVAILCPPVSGTAEEQAAAMLASASIEEVAGMIMAQWQARGQNACNVPAVIVRRFQELAGIPITGSIDGGTSFAMFPILGSGTVPPCNLSL